MKMKTLQDVLNGYIEQCKDTPSCFRCRYKEGKNSKYNRGIKKCLSEYLHQQRVPKNIIDEVLSVMSGYIARFCGTDCGKGHMWEQCMICYIQKHMDCSIPVQVQEYILVSDIEDMMNTLNYNQEYQRIVKDLLDKVDKKTIQDIL